jgi:hypothetical protein
MGNKSASTGAKLAIALAVVGGILALVNVVVDYRNTGIESDGTVVRASTDGTQRALLLSGLHEPTALAVDRSYVYVASPDRILRVGKSGGPPSMVVDQQFNIEGLQVDDEFLCWSDQRDAVYLIKKR